MLRLKGHREDDTLDEVDHRDLLPTDEPGDVEDPAGILPLRGLAIAAATFVPTFLAVVVGFPYLLGSVTTARNPRPPSPGPPVAATAPLSSEVGPDVAGTLSETLRRDSTDRGSAPPAIEPTTPRAPEPAPVTPIPEPAPPPALPPALSLAPAPARPPMARSAPEPRPTPVAPKPDQWTPAAAFADREAAGRLASSIKEQGYPVEVRQDGSSSRPWVVWIGAQPSRARRR